MIRAIFNAPISISRDKNASLNERMDPLHWFYIECIRCPADIPRVWLSISMVQRKCATSETSRVSIVRVSIQENIASSRVEHIFRQAPRNDRIKVAMSSLKWTLTLFTFIRVSVNIHGIHRILVRSEKIRNNRFRNHIRNATSYAWNLYPMNDISCVL